LAFDVVVVPVAVVDERVVTRVFGEQADSLCLFSSAKSLAGFLADDPERLFVMVHGAAVVDYLAHRLDQVRLVVVDAAGPVSMAIPAAVLAGFVDDSDEADSDEADDADEPGPVGAVVGFDLGLDSLWGTVELFDPQRREQQIQALVAKQTTTLGDDAALLRRDMRTWMGRAAGRAAEAGGSQMGFLLARTSEAAAALSVVVYCHAVGQEAGGSTHLGRIEQRLTAKAAPDESFVRILTPGGEVLRHARVKAGSPEVGGENVPLLNIDYWLEAPDRDHVGHVSFSTPHVGARHAITDLADNVVFNGRWVSGGASPVEEVVR